MDRFARIVLGYHGCLEEHATSLLTGERSIEDWKPSSNTWDWLGRGIYFWEHSTQRALEWASTKARRSDPPAKASVIGAVIQLGRCFDLTDVRYTEQLRQAYDVVKARYENEDKALPKNRGSPAGAAPQRELDCMVINTLLDDILVDGEEAVSFQTVRGAFWEGDEAFPGSILRQQSHIQIAVRDVSCILGVFRPNLDVG